MILRLYIFSKHFYGDEVTELKSAITKMGYEVWGMNQINECGVFYYSMASSCGILIYREAIFLTWSSSYLNISCTLRTCYGTKVDFNCRTVICTNHFLCTQTNCDQTLSHFLIQADKKTFTCLFQNCSWDLTGLLPYPVHCRYCTLALTSTQYVMCNVPECTSNCFFLSCTSGCLLLLAILCPYSSFKDISNNFYTVHTHQLDWVLCKNCVDLHILKQQEH
jgi:hypothetical protein